MKLLLANTEKDLTKSEDYDFAQVGESDIFKGGKSWQKLESKSQEDEDGVISVKTNFEYPYPIYDVGFQLGNPTRLNNSELVKDGSLVRVFHYDASIDNEVTLSGYDTQAQAVKK